MTLRNKNRAAGRLRRRTSGGWPTTGWLATFLLIGFLASASCSLAEDASDNAAEAPKQTTITTGSGQQYKTTVHRETEGELNPEDFRQASLLTSRVVSHLNLAARNLADEQSDDAKAELERANGLVKVVRELLPTTTVTTTVTDAQGEEVYRYVDHVQDDRIPLFEGMVAVEVVEPIAEAKEETAEIRGLRLADAELLHTSVLVDLGYVERKINRAMKLLSDKPEDALAQLVLAQTQGIRFAVNKEDDPLVSAQHALQLAERMVKQERFEAAKANLQIAKNHLVLYRGLIAESESDKVRQLEQDITKLQGEIKKEGAAGDIRGFWDRVASWFVREPGEAAATNR